MFWKMAEFELYGGSIFNPSRFYAKEHLVKNECVMNKELAICAEMHFAHAFYILWNNFIFWLKGVVPF